MLNQESCKSSGGEYGTDPGSHKAFHCLLGRQLDQLGPAESDSTDIGEDIVHDDKSCGQKEPYQAFKYVVHDEVSLYVDQVKRHVGPRKLCKLKSVVAFL